MLEDLMGNSDAQSGEKWPSDTGFVTPHEAAKLLNDQIAEIARLTKLVDELVNEGGLNAKGLAALGVKTRNGDQDWYNARAEASDAKVSQLQEQGGKLCCWVGNAMMFAHEAKAAIDKLPANFSMPHSLKIILDRIPEMTKATFGENFELSNHDKARKIYEAIEVNPIGYFAKGASEVIADIEAILGRPEVECQQRSK